MINSSSKRRSPVSIPPHMIDLSSMVIYLHLVALTVIKNLKAVRGGSASDILSIKISILFSFTYFLPGFILFTRLILFLFFLFLHLFVKQNMSQPPSTETLHSH